MGRNRPQRWRRPEVAIHTRRLHGDILVCGHSSAPLGSTESKYGPRRQPLKPGFRNCWKCDAGLPMEFLVPRST